MAPTYTVVTQYPTVEFLGGTQTRDVTAVGIVTIPHNIYTEFRIPDSIYNATQVKDYATAYSIALEALFAVHGVIGVSWGQGPAASGELLDLYTVFVQSDSGNSTGSVTFDNTKFGPATYDPLIAAEVAKLNEVEAL